MEVMYCWRCRMILPFLDEEEYAEIEELYKSCSASIHSRPSSWIRTLWRDISSWPSRRRRIPPQIIESERPTIKVRGPFATELAPVIVRFGELTGLHDMHTNAVMHHRASLLGPDCPQCRLPLRSPKAKMCPECGWDRRDEG